MTKTVLNDAIMVSLGKKFDRQTLTALMDQNAHCGRNVSEALKISAVLARHGHPRASEFEQALEVYDRLPFYATYNAKYFTYISKNEHSYMFNPSLNASRQFRVGGKFSPLKTESAAEQFVLRWGLRAWEANEYVRAGMIYGIWGIATRHVPELKNFVSKYQHLWGTSEIRIYDGTAHASIVPNDSVGFNLLKSFFSELHHENIIDMMTDASFGGIDKSSAVKALSSLTLTALCFEDDPEAIGFEINRLVKAGVLNGEQADIMEKEFFTVFSGAIMERLESLREFIRAYAGFTVEKSQFFEMKTVGRSDQVKNDIIDYITESAIATYRKSADRTGLGSGAPVDGVVFAGKISKKLGPGIDIKKDFGSLVKSIAGDIESLGHAHLADAYSRDFETGKFTGAVYSHGR